MHELESPTASHVEDARIAGMPIHVLEMVSLVAAAGCLFLKPDIDIRFISGWLVATVIASRFARLCHSSNQVAESTHASP